ncbi:MAG: aminoacetone oxidase family FAD-binding enzyme [Sulfurovum sp.]|nr:MAG: aminoacetone oxidase family FAD-binding enzyme [Sulfurovum sp.]
MVDVIIIGAGASGLVSAIVSARRGKKVLILEKNNKIGKKLLATGNGKCNITNQRPTLERFHSQNPKFIAQIFEGYTYQTVRQFFKSIGLELVESKEGKVFPMSLQASSVVNLLKAECEQLLVEIRCDIEVNNLKKREDGYEVIHSKGSEKADALIVATGHLSAPQLGGVDRGITFAKKLGHTVIKSSPTLVQLTSPVNNLTQLAGVKVYSQVSLRLKNGKVIHTQGDVLFTSYGISGLAILDISRWVIQEVIHTPIVVLEIDFMPKMSHEQLLSLMKKSLVKKSKKSIEIWMQGFINKKLILPILKPLKLQHETVGSISSNINHLEEIVKTIKCFKFKIDGSRGYKGAEVATGGVDPKR